MGRLSERDQQTVAGLIEQTQIIRLGCTDFWRQFLPQLNQALRARVPVAYGLTLTEQGPRVAFLEVMNVARVTDEVRADMNAGLSRQPASYVGFSPARPQPGQRNTVKLLSDLRALQTPNNILGIWKGAGVEGHDQIRVLLCEDEALLAWVGAYRPDDEPFTSRERQMLQRLVPALRQRLALDQQLNCAPLAKAALETCIEALAVPAMIVNARGEPQFANTLARRLAEADLRGLTRRLKDCIAGKSSDFALTALAGPGLAPHYLALEAAQPRDVRPLLLAATTRWSLTPRELEALKLLADGLSNRAMAVHLSCAERTVEVHVARLLAKSDSESRSQLIARFWSDGHLEKELRTPHARS